MDGRLLTSAWEKVSDKKKSKTFFIFVWEEILLMEGAILEKQHLSKMEIFLSHLGKSVCKGVGVQTLVWENKFFI